LSEDASFSIGWIENGSILRAKLIGFFSMDTVAAFEEEFWQRVSDRRGASFDAITDVTDHPTQSAEVHEAMTRIGQEAYRRGVRRAAAVVGPSVLSGLQIRRTVANTGLQSATFRTEAEAVAWLRC
jgi:hypothetical protein